MITSNYSTSPYSASDLNTMLGQVNSLQSKFDWKSRLLNGSNNLLLENVKHRSLGAVNLLSELRSVPRVFSEIHHFDHVGRMMFIFGAYT
jgi:hypothetical protein